MIDFGLFSSQLPYIILFAGYLLYFGASSLNRHTRDESSLNSKVSERHTISFSGNNGKTLICEITSSVKSAAEKLKYSIEKIPGNSFSTICYPPGTIKPLIHFIGNSVFSRPPPFSSRF